MNHNKPASKQPDVKGRVTVIHRAKHDRNIGDEPEMKELKRMIRESELDRDRTLEHLRQKKSWRLTVEQLCKASTLSEAKLDQELEAQIKQYCPDLLKRSTEE